MRLPPLLAVITLIITTTLSYPTAVGEAQMVEVTHDIATLG